MGLTDLGHKPPPRIPDVVQRVVVVDPASPLGPQLPRRCAKCGAAALGLIGRELRCQGAFAGCGASFFLVTKEYAAPEPKRPAAHHQTARWKRVTWEESA